MAYLWDRASSTYLDSVAMEEGRFHFEGIYEKPCQLTILDHNNPDKAKQFITILVEPGDIKIERRPTMPMPPIMWHRDAILPKCVLPRPARSAEPSWSRRCTTESGR